MSNSDINKFKDKESDLYEEYKQPNAANQDISYKKNKQHPIIFENEDFIDLEPNFFSNLYLEGVHFKQCVFGKLESENTIFQRCSFENCNFTTSEVLIQDSTFREECLFTNVHNITFRNVLFETTIFAAYITSCSFHDCNFLSCNYETLNVIEDSNFHGTAIQNSSKHSFKDIAFILTYIDFCSFENLIFIDTRFLDSSITHSDFNYVVFQRTEEEEDEDDEKSIIKITDTNENRLLNYSNNRFNRCDLRHIDVNHANFEKSVFQHTKMPLVLNFCNFQTCIFTLSMFSDDRPVPRDFNFDYEQTSFYHAVSFMGSVFQGVSFTRNDMSRVNFRNIRYEGTIFFHDGLIVKGLFGVPNDLVTRNIKFENYTLIDCKFANEIRNLSFINSDIRRNVFYNNTEFNQANYRSINNIHLQRTQGPVENYVINDVNVPELDYINDEEEYRLQIEAEKQRVTNVIERAIDIDYEIPESNSVPNNNFFPQENDETVKIFDIIEGELVMDQNFINTFTTNYPNHKIIIKKQKNNWYPYLIDMEYITKFLEDVTSDNRNESSYLSNIIFICDDVQTDAPTEEELGKYLSQTAYMNMKYFGIQGLLIPLTDIFALINPQNREKQIFIVENIQFEEEKKGLLSLAYAVNYQGADCTDIQVITAGELQYFHKWKQMLSTLATPISSRAPSATSQISTNTSFIPINSENNNKGVDVNYSADEEDNEDEIDSEISEEEQEESEESEEEIVNAFNNKRPAKQNDESRKRKKTGGKTKKRINKQKNKKTKKQKTKK